MKKIFDKEGIKSSFRTKSFRAGGYGVLVSAIVVVIAIVINVIVGALPTQYTQLDATSNQIFTISDQTEKLLAGLEDDVTLYWVVRDGKENDSIEMLLNRYASLSSHVTLVTRDPDKYPNFATQYTSTVYDNSVLVESGTKTRYIDYYDIVVTDYSNYYYTGSYETYFDGESAITSAIDYVVSDDLPVIYTLSGHGESELATTFTEAIEKENMEVETLTLITEEAVPEDADMILINSPSSDISTEEAEKLEAYLETGGNIFLITGPAEDDETFDNLYELLGNYGVSAAEGIVIEANGNNYASGYQHYLLPTIKSHTITDPLIEENYYIFLPIAQGIEVADELPDGVSVDQILVTSSSAYSKVAGYNLSTFEKESGDIDGPFALGVAITDTIDDETEAKLVWISSANVVSESANQSVSGANQDLFLNAIGWMCEQDESSISIHSKSLTSEALTITESSASGLAVLMIGIIPAVLLAIGIIIAIRRKKR